MNVNLFKNTYPCILKNIIWGIDRIGLQRYTFIINRFGLCKEVVMEKFFALPEEKQTKIIDAALKTFGDNGYKKASVSDIAAEAGISKAMVFHYFGTKKALYLYLINYCGTMITSEVNEKFDSSVTDFFDRIIQTSEIELSVMRKHPAIISFIKGVYFESNEEVADDIKALMSQGEDFRSKIAFDGIDTSKFKDGTDITLLLKMLLWMTDGLMSSMRNSAEVDFDSLCRELYSCMYFLKKNLYKEEYL
jgi:AcrR family transcriptional regulator